MKPVDPKRRNARNSDDYDHNFSKLISLIIQGDVILVVGNNFEFNNEKNRNVLLNLGEKANFTDYIFEVVNESYGTDATDFNELQSHPLFSFKDSITGHQKKANIYLEIDHVIKSAELTVDDVSESLIKLLSTGFFRFVLTTSYTPLVEIAMKNQWGENNVKILNIYDSDLTKRDISINHSELRSPTVYYLLGKHGTIQKFVATDNDYLQLLKTMIVDMSNSNLMALTASKHLLVLGCDQDDWLFRFLWFTLKTNTNKIDNEYVGRLQKDVKLDKFLTINNVTLCYDCKQFADKIYEALIRAQETKIFNDPRNMKWDVFISYSRKDGDVAQRIYEALTNTGLKVWYDRNNLGGRGSVFMDYIYEAIRSCTIFMPILSTTITEQREELHPYRLEWDCAISEGPVKQTGTTSCIPVIEAKYDINARRFQDKIPGIFTKLDGYIYNASLPKFEEWALKVRNLISNKE